MVETNQPGVVGLKSSQDLGLIKVVMIPEAEEKQTESIQSEKISRGASSEVLTGIPWIWALGETLPC